MIQENNIKKLANEMKNVKKEHGYVNSLFCWAKAIRLSEYSKEVMIKAFERYVDPEDYHPDEKNRLLNFRRLKLIA